MKDEIKIITLGDIFENIETEEKAFRFKDYIKDLQEENQRLKERIEYLERSNNRREDTIMGLRDEIIDQKDYENVLNELEKIIQTCIYGIEPEGCSINFNCEYDSEEDYISGMQTQARLNTYKFVLKQLKELKESDK